MTIIKDLHPNGSTQPKNIDLWEFHLYYQNMPPARRWLDRTKLDEFYKNNGGRIQTIESEIGKIQMEQFVMEDGKVKSKERLRDDKGGFLYPNEEPLPMYKDGFDDTTFQAAFNKLMSLPTIIA